MVNGAFQACGYLLAMAGWIATVITCLLPVWAKREVPDGKETLGLWISCFFQASGEWTCRYHNESFLGLPLEMKVAKGTSLAAITLGFIGLILGIIGLECTTLVSHKMRTKSRLVIAAGIHHLIGGISLCIGVSLVASTLSPPQSSNSLGFAYGEALYVGWGGMSASLLGGVVLCCASCNSGDRDYRNANYSPKPDSAAGE